MPRGCDSARITLPSSAPSKGALPPSAGSQPAYKTRKPESICSPASDHVAKLATRRSLTYGNIGS